MALDASLKQSVDGVRERLAQASFPAHGGAKDHGEFPEFEAEAFVGFQRVGRVALEHVPDLDQQLAGDSGHRHIAVAFAGKEFPAPLAKDCMATTPKNGLGTLDKQMPDVTTSASSDSQADILAFAALALTGIEPDVGHELLGTVEAPDVADDSQQRKGAHDAHAEHLHAAHHLGIVGHLCGDQAVKPLASLFGLSDIGKVLVEDLCLQHRPLPLFADPLGGGLVLKAVFAQPDAVSVEV